jgi:pSer/pThr/pTyr-binding forkhead associated (FHA) protein
MPQPPHGPPGKRPAPQPYEGTRVESAEEIRQAILARRAATKKEAGPTADTTPFRPSQRPPLALLCILDDGKEEGEWVRLRGDRYVIGRTEGDIVIPHDNMMSGRHAELARHLDQGHYRWHLTDLNSTNGTFVRVGTAALKNGQELLIGGCCYRFDAAPQSAPTMVEAPMAAEEPPAKTLGWPSVLPAGVVPSLLEVTAQGEGRRYLLSKPDNWLGRDAGTCAVVLAHDPLVSPRHARLYYDAKGRWYIENNSSLNGTWLRIDHMALDAGCQFQLGEQRFLLRVR